MRWHSAVGFPQAALALSTVVDPALNCAKHHLTAAPPTGVSFFWIVVTMSLVRTLSFLLRSLSHTTSLYLFISLSLSLCASGPTLIVALCPCPLDFLSCKWEKLSHFNCNRKRSCDSILRQLPAVLYGLSPFTQLAGIVSRLAVPMSLISLYFPCVNILITEFLRMFRYALQFQTPFAL